MLRVSELRRSAAKGAPAGLSKARANVLFCRDARIFDPCVTLRMPRRQSLDEGLSPTPFDVGDMPGGERRSWIDARFLPTGHCDSAGVCGQ